MRLLLSMVILIQISCVHTIDTEFVELSKLAQNIKKYDKREIITAGFLKYRPEGYALYLNIKDLENISTKRSIWLEFDNLNGFEKLHLKKVIVEGVVDQNNPGHMSLWPGSLKVNCLIEYNKSNKCKNNYVK